MGDEWGSTESGNPCLIHKQRRITVFERERGWKFCVAKIQGDDDPYFSEAYFSEDAAKFEAVAWMDGRPSQYPTRSEDRGRARKERWEAQIVERANLYQQIVEALPLASNVTELRKIERKVESHIRQEEWQMTQYCHDGVSKPLIDQAEALADNFRAMPPVIKARIEEIKAKRRK
jgi:hypothetical protein